MSSTRRPRVEPLEGRQLLSGIFTVTNTLDDGSPGSFRWAITQVDGDTSDSTNSPDQIAFNLPQSDPGYSAAGWTIAPLSALPAVTNPVVIDGYTQPGASPNTNGPGLADNAVLKVVLSGAKAPAGTNGLELSAAGVTVRGLVVNGFAAVPASGNGGAGILIDGAGGDAVAGNFIGTNARGDAAVSNSGGGVLLLAGQNTIGGTTPDAANLVSGNYPAAVWLDGAGATGNRIEGNLIGTDATGTVSVANNGVGAVRIDGAPGNTVGGVTASARNVIAGNNTRSIEIDGVTAQQELVEGNFFDTNVAGTADVTLIGDEHGGGIVIDGGAGASTIGGTTTGARNVIAETGVVLRGAGVSGNVVEGNFIGTDVTGTIGLGFEAGGTVLASDGVLVDTGPTNNTIGGTAAGAGNLISGNGAIGVQLYGVGTADNLVAGNLIGLASDGTTPLGNAASGVLINLGAVANTIGGTTAAARNVIANAAFPLGGPMGSEVVIDGPGTVGNLVEGNFIGTNATGTVADGDGNVTYGVAITGSGNTIGGTTPAARNVIAVSGTSSLTPSNDVYIGGGGGLATGNVVEGNYLGVDVTGTTQIGSGTGLLIDVGPTHNTIGGTAAGAGNVVAGIAVSGGYYAPNWSNDNVIQGNFVGTDASGERVLPHAYGIVILNSAGNTVGGTTAGAGNVVAANLTQTKNLFGLSNVPAPLTITMGSTGNVVLGNSLGVDRAGTTSLGDPGSGVIVSGGSDSNQIGAPGEGNTISGNAQDGIVLTDASTAGNAVEGNFIGASAQGTPIANAGDGVLVESGASGNTIGGIGTGAGNVIASNEAAGVAVIGTTTVHDAILGNAISGNAKLGIDLGGTGVPFPGDSTLGVGPNDDQGVPVLTTTTVQAGQTVITGLVRGVPSSVYTIELFADAAEDPSGYGQGQTFLGRVTGVTTDAYSTTAFRFTVPSDLTGQFISATATSATGDTSEFAHDLPVPTEPPTVALQVVATPTFVKADQGSTVTFGFRVSNQGPDAATNLDLTDDLPAGLTNVQPSASLGTPVLSGGAFTDRIASLPSGGSVTVDFTATYAASTPVSDSLHAAADEPSSTPSSSQSATVVVATGIASTTTLEVNPTEIGVGQSLTAYVAVDLAPDAVIPQGVYGVSGTVTLLVDGVPQPGSIHVVGSRGNIPQSLALAVFTLHSLPAGPHDISATFTGDTDFLNSQATQDVHLVVQNGPVNPTTVQISADHTSSSYGQSVTVTANVIGPPPFVPPGGFFPINTPTGTVTFFVDGKPQTPEVPLALPVFGDTHTASLTLKLPTGTHQILARYNGNGSILPPNQSAPIVLTVHPAVTSVALTVAPDPSPSGGTVMLDAAVTRPGASTGTLAPLTGLVDFRDGATLLARVPLRPDGHAQVTTSALTVGMHDFVAVYEGDANDGGSASASVVHTVLGSPGPRVLSAVRYGPTLPNAVVLTFSAPLDPARARDPGNYRVVGPRGRRIGVDAVAYTPWTDEVMLLLSRNLNARAVYRLTIVGTGPSGVTDAYGNPLDSAGAGHPGSNFTTMLRPLRVTGRHTPAGPVRRPGHGDFRP